MAQKIEAIQVEPGVKEQTPEIKAPVQSAKTESAVLKATAQSNGPAETAKSEGIEPAAAGPADTRTNTATKIDRVENAVLSVAEKSEIHRPVAVESTQPAERIIEFTEYQAPTKVETLPEIPVGEVAATPEIIIVEEGVDEAHEDVLRLDPDAELIVNLQNQLEPQELADNFSFDELSPDADALFAEAGEDEAELGNDLDVSLAETETAFLPTPEFEKPMLELDFEVTPQDIVAAQSITQEVFQEKLEELFEPLPPEHADTATGLVEAIVELAAKLPDEISNQAESLHEEELQELCAQLFELMDIDYNEEVISKFVVGISPVKTELNKAEATVGSALETGTHEQKLTNYLILRNLSLLMSQKQPRHVMLGRYALGINLALLHSQDQSYLAAA